MSTCVNCPREASIVWSPPGTPEVLYCIKCRPSFTYKEEYVRYAQPVPVVMAPVEEPAPKTSKKTSKGESPSEAPAEETTAPAEEPTP